MQITTFRNEEKVSTEEVLDLFTQTLNDCQLFENDEIEQLADIAAKNPVDRFIISEEPDIEVMQGDILIWSELTEEYKEHFPLVQIGEDAKSMVLQDDDSMTGDHRLVPLKGANFSLKKGKFLPSILKGVAWGNNAYDCKILEIDTPFVITHREHGNITLTAGKYMICSSLDSKTLRRMQD